MGDYLTGFGGHFATEAVAGALPIGRNSPQKPAFGLYSSPIPRCQREALRPWPT